jgi:alkanesulfonate monooxygenase SsuD/methylene tetrahydromethanopterin reductase-like flavin-dependent oxidoreductase (luciferase family)
VYAPGHVAETDEQAREEFSPHWLATVLASAGSGFTPPAKDSFAYDVGPDGALYVGSPETVANKIVANLTTLRASRFDLKFGMPGLTHDQLMTNIELYGTRVLPRVRQLVSSRSANPPDNHHTAITR